MDTSTNLLRRPLAASRADPLLAYRLDMSRSSLHGSLRSVGLRRFFEAP